MSNPAERAIFLQAIEEENLEDRLAYLDSACGSDHALRASVESLLQAHDQPAALLDHPLGSDHSRPSLILADLDDSVNLIGLQVGPYKLMELIGEGGFGLVFVAEQQEPLRRKVALKIVRPGMGSKEVLARFEAERQAVAMMNHPNIAQVFDVGVTTDSRPYFAMELVRGLPIVEFCDRQQLSVKQRLELMVDVCSAVHHAHQKGIIHRDLKPSNVMVTLHDGKPVPKVIDFGIAKAMGEKLTDKSVYTCFFSMLGTPLYMSPEQAEMSGLDVDTRSDTYSLGVLLYELLTGNTPFDRERLNSAGLDELRRIIREEDPPRPSARLSTCATTLSTIADRRRVRPQELTLALRGDLDWIVMKTLEKDRTRRYDSAAALAEDIRRYLRRQPIGARPPSNLYRLQKYASRHRVVFLTTALIGVSMVLGTAGSLWQMSKALQERNAKDQALQEATQAKTEAIAAKLKVEQFAQDLIRANELVISGEAEADSQRWASAARDFNAAVEIQPSYYLPRVQRAQLYARLSLWPEAAKDYVMALDTGAPISQSQWMGVPALLLYTDHTDAFERVLRFRIDEISTSDGPPWMLLRDIAVGRSDPSINYKHFLSVAHSSLAPRPFPNQPQPPHFGHGGPRDRRERRERPNAPAHPGPKRDPFGRPTPIDDSPTSVRKYVTAMLHLRAGEADAAVELFEEAGRDARWPGGFLIHAPMAIAHYRNREIKLASEALDRSDASILQFLNSSSNDLQNGRESPWFDLVEGLLLNREAWLLIRGLSPPLTSAFDEVRLESLSQIQESQLSQTLSSPDQQPQ